MTPVSKPTWIEWSGGKRPVHREALVRVRLRSGDVCGGTGGDFFWRWGRTFVSVDIVAYWVAWSPRIGDMAPATAAPAHDGPTVEGVVR